MCNYHEMPEFPAEIMYWEPNFIFNGANEFAQRLVIESVKTAVFTPPLNSGQKLYCCENCGQHWYIEFLPEEETSPAFALKNHEALQLTDEIIRSKKQFLSILARGGFDSAPCLKNECPNFCPNGRSFCHLHLSLF